MAAPGLRSAHRLRRRLRRQRRTATRIVLVLGLVAAVIWAPTIGAQDEPAPTEPDIIDPTKPAPVSEAPPEATPEPAPIEEPPAVPEPGPLPSAEPEDDSGDILCYLYDDLVALFGPVVDGDLLLSDLELALGPDAPPGLVSAIDSLRGSSTGIEEAINTLAGYLGPICEPPVVTLDFDGTIVEITGACVTTPVIGAQDQHFVLKGDDFFGVMTLHFDEDSLFLTVATEFDVYETSLITSEVPGTGTATIFEPDDADPRSFVFDYDVREVEFTECYDVAACQDLFAIWDALLYLSETQERLEESTGLAPVEIGAIDEDLGHLANVVPFCFDGPPE